MSDESLAALRQECFNAIKARRMLDWSADADVTEDWLTPIGYALDAIVPLLARERQARAQAWQPMETAPKDGTFVLLWWDNEPIVGEWFMPTRKPAEPRWVAVAALEYEMEGQPTLWSPLPSLPAAPDASGGKE